MLSEEEIQAYLNEKKERETIISSDEVFILPCTYCDWENPAFLKVLTGMNLISDGAIWDEKCDGEGYTEGESSVSMTALDFEGRGYEIFFHYIERDDFGGFVKIPGVTVVREKDIDIEAIETAEGLTMWLTFIKRLPDFGIMNAEWAVNKIAQAYHITI